MRLASCPSLMALTSVPLLLAGCSSESVRCTPGQSLACACTSGASGAQICKPDSTYGPCVCDAKPDGSSTLDGTGGKPDSRAADRSPILEGPPPPTCMACTDIATCCTTADIKCSGDPDHGIICTCDKVWNCSKSPTTCEQMAPTPSAANWNCTWSSTTYQCTGTATPPSVLPGWTCSQIAAGGWNCVRDSIPNPCNTPAGLKLWFCTVQPQSSGPANLSCFRGV